jgi:hypothetical protein
VTDLPGELNLNNIRWPKLMINYFTVFIKCKLYFRKKSLMEKDEHAVDYSLT